MPRYESKSRAGTTGDLSTAHHQVAVTTPHKCRQTEPGCYRELTAPLSVVAGARELTPRCSGLVSQMRGYVTQAKAAACLQTSGLSEKAGKEEFYLADGMCPQRHSSLLLPKQLTTPNLPRGPDPTPPHHPTQQNTKTTHCSKSATEKINKSSQFRTGRFWPTPRAPLLSAPMEQRQRPLSPDQPSGSRAQSLSPQSITFLSRKFLRPGTCALHWLEDSSNGGLLELARRVLGAGTARGLRVPAAGNAREEGEPSSSHRPVFSTPSPAPPPPLQVHPGGTRPGNQGWVSAARAGALPPAPHSPSALMRKPRGGRSARRHQASRSTCRLWGGACTSSTPRRSQPWKASREAARASREFQKQRALARRKARNTACPPGSSATPAASGVSNRLSTRASDPGASCTGRAMPRRRPWPPA